MADRVLLGFFIVMGLLSLAACTSVQTTGERQAYFETASAAKLAWQPSPNVSTSFQGCMWGSVDYPCQPHSRLDAPKQVSYKTTKPEPSRLPAHKKVSHTKSQRHTKPLPLCQPVLALDRDVAPISTSIPSPNKTTT